MLTLLLCRHGNTFNPGEPAVWVGAEQDLPLVEKGHGQARALGEHFRDQGIRPDAFCTGPLQRTRQTAATMRAAWGMEHAPLTVDPALTEINYGRWGGRHSDDIAAEYGADVLHGWQKQGTVPPGGVFSETEPEILRRVERFIKNIYSKYQTGTIVVISSNGLLRYFLKLTPGQQAFHEAVAAGTLTMATGHYGIMACQDQQVRCEGWNLNPLKPQY